jgi:hypothetical protein
MRCVTAVIASRYLKLSAVVAVLLPLAGCGTSPEEDLMKNWIGHIEETRGILSKVSDEASAQTALPELKKSIEAFDAIVASSKVDTRATVPENVMKKYGEKFERAGNAFRGERERIQNRHPEAWKIVEGTVIKVKGVKSPGDRVLGR